MEEYKVGEPYKPFFFLIFTCVMVRYSNHLEKKGDEDNDEIVLI